MIEEQTKEIILASQEAEENIIGTLVADSDTHKYIEDIEIDDFYYIQNKKIFEIIKELHKKEQNIDLITIKETGIAKKYNGQKLFDILIRATEKIDFATNIEKAIDIVKNLSMKRKVQKFAKEIYNEVIEIDMLAKDFEIKNDIMQKLKNIKTMQKSKVIEMKDVMFETTQDLENKYKKRNDLSYRTGYLELDNIIEGLHEQEFTIVAARPRCWKNSICSTNVRTYSQQGKICIFYKSRNECKTARI